MPVTVHHNKIKKAYDFLKTHPIGVLATVDPNAEPYAATIYFTADNNLNIRFITKTGTKKADNLEHKNHAMLVVYDAQTQTTVQVLGQTKKINDRSKVDDLFTKIIYTSLDTSGNDVPPISHLEEGDYIAYVLEPKQVRMAVFSQAKFGKYEEIFKIIEPEHS